VLYFLTPPPTGIFVQVPGSQINTLTMLEAVLGRLDNLSEWEVLLDEWNFASNEELPFPLSRPKAGGDPCRSGRSGPHPRQHLIRRHSKGDLMTLREPAVSWRPGPRDPTTRGPRPLDEEEYIARIEAMRADIAKGKRLAKAQEQFAQESVGEFERHQKQPPNKDGGP